MNFVKRFIRNWFTSASLLNLSDEFSTYERKIIALKDDPAQAKLYNQLNGLVEDLKKAIEEEETQKGWKIFKEIRRLLVWSLPREEMISRAHTVLKETESKTQSSPWRLLAVKEILGVGEDGKTLRTDLTAGQVIKAAEILDDHQDNFYEKLETLRRRSRTLSWITFVSLVAWVWIGPQISEFPLQKELSDKDLAAQKKALYEVVDSLINSSNASQTDETTSGNDSSESNPNKENQSDKQQDTTAQNITDKTATAAKNNEKDSSFKACECKDSTVTCCVKEYSGIKDIHKRPRWLALLVILTGIIGAVVSGFIRTIY
ncbi:MAG TPA: hypothetical protein DCF33_13835, partial [Saprospirales bacterium]|nr:hypothetical protein [Saprospirales bacterium]